VSEVDINVEPEGESDAPDAIVAPVVVTDAGGGNDVMLQDLSARMLAHEEKHEREEAEREAAEAEAQATADLALDVAGDALEEAYSAPEEAADIVEELSEEGAGEGGIPTTDEAPPASGGERFFDGATKADYWRP
jgi:hypothetical protein